MGREACAAGGRTCMSQALAGGEGLSATAESLIWLRLGEREGNNQPGLLSLEAAWVLMRKALRKKCGQPVRGEVEQSVPSHAKSHSKWTGTQWKNVQHRRPRQAASSIPHSPECPPRPCAQNCDCQSATIPRRRPALLQRPRPQRLPQSKTCNPDVADFFASTCNGART